MEKALGPAGWLRVGLGAKGLERLKARLQVRLDKELTSIAYSDVALSAERLQTLSVLLDVCRKVEGLEPKG